MATECNKCGLDIAFKQIANGKWRPTNSDGSNHRNACRSMQFTRLTPDERAALATRDAERHPPRMMLARDGSHFWSGAVPPWDESLDPFREFTPDEIATGAVCKPRDSE